MTNPLSTYYDQSAQGLGVILPGLMDTGIGKTLMRKQQLEAAQKAQNQKDLQTRTTGVKEVFDQRKKEFDFEAVDRVLDENRKKQFDQIFQDYTNLYEQSINAGGRIDRDALQEIDQRAKDFEFNTGQSKLFLDEGKAAREAMKGTGYVNMSAFDNAYGDLLKDAVAGDASPEKVQEKLLSNPSLVNGQKLAKNIKDNFQKKYMEIVKDEGYNTSTSRMQWDLPLIMEEKNGRMVPKLDENAQVILDTNDPALISSFKEDPLKDSYVQMIQQQMKDSGEEDATYQDAIGRIMDSQKFFKQETSSKSDVADMARLRAELNANSGDGSSEGFEIEESTDNFKTEFSEIGDDNIAMTSTAFAATPGLTRPLTLSLEKGSEAQKYDVLGFKKTADGIKVRLAGKETTGIGKIEKSIPVQEVPFSNSIKNAIINSKGFTKKKKEAFEGMVKELEEYDPKNRYVDRDKLEAEVSTPLKGERADNAKLIVKNLLNLGDDAIEVTKPFYGWTGNDTWDDITITLPDGMKVTINNDEQGLQKLKELAYKANPDRYTTDKETENKKATNGNASNQSATGKVSTGGAY